MNRSPEFKLGNWPPLPLVRHRAVLRRAAFVGTCFPPPIGPHSAESIDLTDPALLLPPPALSFSIHTSPLRYRPDPVPLPRPLLFSRGSHGSFGRDPDRPANHDANISGIYSSFFLSFSPSLRPSRDDDVPPPSGQPHFWMAYASRLRADLPASPPKWNFIPPAGYQLAGGYRPIAWPLLATILPAGKLRHRYIRYFHSPFAPYLPFLPATTIVPLPPPRDHPHDTDISGIYSSFLLSSPLPFDHPAMVTCPQPHFRLADVSCLRTDPPRFPTSVFVPERRDTSLMCYQSAGEYFSYLSFRY